MKETRLSIPYGSFGVLFSLILVSMIAAYCVEPSGMKKSDGADKDADDPPNRKLEVILMILLFFYIGICVNLESAFSSECNMIKTKRSRKLERRKNLRKFTVYSESKVRGFAPVSSLHSQKLYRKGE